MPKSDKYPLIGARTRSSRPNAFPHGRPLFQGDQGGLPARLRILKDERRLVMQFGKDLQVLACTGPEAKQMAAVFRERVRSTWGEITYRVDELPIRVHPEGTVVLSTMPMILECLVMNPEVMLAWAQRLDEVADTILAARE